MGKKLKPYFLDEVVSRTSCGEIGNRATGGFIAILSLFQKKKKKNDCIQNILPN